MIKSKYGEVNIKGSKEVILADLGVIFKALLEEFDDIDEDDIKRMLDKAKMTNKEITEQLIKKLIKFIGEDKDDTL